MEAWIFNPPSSSVLPQHPGQGPRSPNLVQGVWSSPGGTAVQDVLTERMNDWICNDSDYQGCGGGKILTSQTVGKITFH